MGAEQFDLFRICEEAYELNQEPEVIPEEAKMVTSTELTKEEEQKQNFLSLEFHKNNGSVFTLRVDNFITVYELKDKICRVS